MKKLFTILGTPFIIFLSSCIPIEEVSLDPMIDIIYRLKNVNTHTFKIEYEMMVKNNQDLNLGSFILKFDTFDSFDNYLGELTITVNKEFIVKHNREGFFNGEMSITPNTIIPSRIELKDTSYKVQSFFDTHIDDFSNALIIFIGVFGAMIAWSFIKDIHVHEFTEFLTGHVLYLLIPFGIIFIFQLGFNLFLVDYGILRFNEWIWMIYSFVGLLTVIPLGYIFLFIKNWIQDWGAYKI